MQIFFNSLYRNTQVIIQVSRVRDKIQKDYQTLYASKFYPFFMPEVPVRYTFDIL